MDFFDFAAVAEELYSMFFVEDKIWLYLLVGFLGYAVMYVFQTVGLYTIATREGFAHKWMAFVPFFNTYYIGVCGQKNRFMGIDAKKISFVTAVYQLVLASLYILFYVAWWVVQKNNGFIEGSTTEVIWGQEYTLPVITINPNFGVIYPGLRWAGWCYSYLRSYIIGWLEIGLLFLRIALFNCFFQTYSSRHYFIFSLLGVLFPISGVFIFVVKNNRAMNYADYTRMVQEQIYRQYRSQQNDPYNGANAGYNGGRPEHKPAEDPFSEYGSSDSSGPKDPFDEFKN